MSDADQFPPLLAIVQLFANPNYASLMKPEFTHLFLTEELWTLYTPNGKVFLDKSHGLLRSMSAEGKLDLSDRELQELAETKTAMFRESLHDAPAPPAGMHWGRIKTAAIVNLLQNPKFVFHALIRTNLEAIFFDYDTMAIRIHNYFHGELPHETKVENDVVLDPADFRVHTLHDAKIVAKINDELASRPWITAAQLVNVTIDWHPTKVLLVDVDHESLEDLEGSLVELFEAIERDPETGSHAGLGRFTLAVAPDGYAMSGKTIIVRDDPGHLSGPEGFPRY